MQTTGHTQAPFALNRFLHAQGGGVYETALLEIRGGRKHSHWMWFVFPQFNGLGSSPTSHYYAIKSVAEARAYLEHPVLGARLRESAFAAVNGPASSASELLGSPDDLKLRSSATLFARVDEPGSVFEEVLERFFGGEADQATLELMGVRGGDRPR